MIAVDTNVIVRLLTKDDAEQFQQSLKLFQTNDIFICDTVILEVEWVLRFAYKFKPNQICQGLKNLFGLSNVYLSDAILMARVIEWHEAGLDFADALHLAKTQHCAEFYTFDRQFISKAQSLTQCEVKQPL